MARAAFYALFIGRRWPQTCAASWRRTLNAHAEPQRTPPYHITARRRAAPRTAPGAARYFARAASSLRSGRARACRAAPDMRCCRRRCAYFALLTVAPAALLIFARRAAGGRRTTMVMRHRHTPRRYQCLVAACLASRMFFSRITQQHLSAPLILVLF